LKPFSKYNFGILKSRILEAFSNSTIGHLIVECEVIILWAFSMGQSPYVDLYFASQSFISFNQKYSKRCKKQKQRVLIDPSNHFICILIDDCMDGGGTTAWNCFVGPR